MVNSFCHSAGTQTATQVSFCAAALRVEGWCPWIQGVLEDERQREVLLLVRAEVEGRGSPLMAHHQKFEAWENDFNSISSHIPAAAYQSCFLLCIKPPFIVKEYSPRKQRLLSQVG